MRLRLRELMDEHGVNGAQVADALGITPGSVSAWLIGERKRGDRTVKAFPDLASIEALCVLFGVTPGELLEIEAVTTPTGKTLEDLGAPSRRGRPPRVVTSGNLVPASEG